METPEKFDDIIRSKFEEREIPFDEANWENIKKMSDAARENKKRRRWFFIFFTGLVCGIAVILPFLFNSNSKNMVAEKKTTELTKTENKQITKQEFNNETSEKKENPHGTLQNTDAKETDETAGTENKTVASKKEITSSPEKMKTKIRNNNSSSSVTTVKKEKTAQVIASSIGNNESATKNNSVSANSVAIANEEKSKSVNNDAFAKEEKKKSVVPVKIIEEEKPNPIVKNETENENPVSPGNSVTDKKEAPAKTEPVSPAKKDEKKATEISPAISVPVIANLNEAKDTTAKAGIENAISAAADTTSKAVVPVIAATKDTINKNTDSTAKANRWLFGIVAGINQCTRITPIAGVEIRKLLGKRWIIGAGLNYTYINFGQNPVKTLAETNYDFGSTISYTEISLTKIHYAMLNVFTEFNINPKNSLVAGVNLYGLVTVSNEIYTYSQTNSGLPYFYHNGEVLPGKKTWGYSKNVSPFDVAIMAGYRRKIYGRLDAGLYLNYGLLNIFTKQTSNNSSNGFDYNNAQKSTSIFHLVLKYNLFKK